MMQRRPALCILDSRIGPLKQVRIDRSYLPASWYCRALLCISKTDFGGEVASSVHEQRHTFFMRAPTSARSPFCAALCKGVKHCIWITSCTGKVQYLVNSDDQRKNSGFKYVT